MAMEIIREQLYRRYNQEIPYTTDIVIEGWTPLKDDFITIDVALEVSKQSRIVLNSILNNGFREYWLEKMDIRLMV